MVSYVSHNSDMISAAIHTRKIQRTMGVGGRLGLGQYQRAFGFGRGIPQDDHATSHPSPMTLKADQILAGKLIYDDLECQRRSLKLNPAD